MVSFKAPTIEEHKSFVSYKNREATKYLVVHCSATQNVPSFTWKTIDQMHRQQGWLGIGYHFVICTDGTIQRGRPLEAIGSHVKGYNNCSVGICLIGGVDSKGKSVDNFTDEQKESLKCLLDYLRGYYKDEVTVLGHRDFEGVHKDCPCFDVKGWYKGAKFARYEDTEAFWSKVVFSKGVFKDFNGDPEEGDVVRIE
jgi:N-acetyl-anhydromuramyl-L-alanine amidase AmpD